MAVGWRGKAPSTLLSRQEREREREIERRERKEDEVSRGHLKQIGQASVFVAADGRLFCQSCVALMTTGSTSYSGKLFHMHMLSALILQSSLYAHTARRSHLGRRHRPIDLQLGIRRCLGSRRLRLHRCDVRREVEVRIASRCRCQGLGAPVAVAHSLHA
jgi:hypothetical protein